MLSLVLQHCFKIAHKHLLQWLDSQVPQAAFGSKVLFNFSHSKSLSLIPSDLVCDHNLTYRHYL